MYCLLSVALTLFGMFVEKETFALTRAAPDQPSLVLRSSMPRFQENYTIAVRPRGTEPGCSEEAKLTSSVGAFFDSNGELAARVFKAEVVKMVECVQAGGAAQNGEAKKSQ